MGKKHVDIAFFKHGDVIEEYQALKGEAEWKMFDSIKPYIAEITESAHGKPSIIFGSDEIFRTGTKDNFTLYTFPLDKERKLVFSIITKLWYFFKTFLILVKYRPKVIVVLGRFFRTFIPYYYCKFFEGKIITVITGSLKIERSKIINSKLLNKYLSLLKSPIIKMILSRGESPVSELKELGVTTNKCKVFYPEYPQDFFKEYDINTEFGYDIEILYVGRFQSDKGVLEIPQMLKKINMENIRFNLIGWGQEEENLKRIVSENNQEKQIRFLGKCESHKIYSYLKHADILIIPSKHESLCKVSIEGVLSMIPVVAYDIGGIKFNVIDGKTGFIIEPENKTDFINAIKKLIEHPGLRQQMRENAKVDRERFLKPDNTFSKLVGDFIEKELA